MKILRIPVSSKYVLCLIVSAFMYIHFLKSYCIFFEIDFLSGKFRFFFTAVVITTRDAISRIAKTTGTVQSFFATFWQSTFDIFINSEPFSSEISGHFFQTGYWIFDKLQDTGAVSRYNSN